MKLVFEGDLDEVVAEITRLADSLLLTDREAEPPAPTPTGAPRWTGPVRVVPISPEAVPPAPATVPPARLVGPSEAQSILSDANEPHKIARVIAGLDYSAMDHTWIDVICDANGNARASDIRAGLSEIRESYRRMIRMLDGTSAPIPIPKRSTVTVATRAEGDPALNIEMHSGSHSLDALRDERRVSQSRSNKAVEPYLMERLPNVGDYKPMAELSRDQRESVWIRTFVQGDSRFQYESFGQGKASLVRRVKE